MSATRQVRLPTLDLARVHTALATACECSKRDGEKPRIRILPEFFPTSPPGRKSIGSITTPNSSRAVHTTAGA